MIESKGDSRRRPVVGFVPPEETLLFALKVAMDRWEARQTASGLDLSEPVRELVWELLLLCSEHALTQGNEPPRDAYRMANEIGRRVTERMDRREAIKRLRDQLLESVLVQIQSYPQVIPFVLMYFMAIGDAIWESYAEQLRVNIRQEKRQRLTEQLRVAKRIQQHLLPKTIPQIDGFDFAGLLLPADEVGGDYWSVKSYPDDKIVTMKLADVTGHGIGAATLVAAVKFISGGFYRGASSPQEVMQRTNDVLVRETPSDILVTMIYAWLYPDSCQIRLVNAGHHPVFIANEQGFVDVEPTGPLLGLQPSVYEEQVRTVGQGDILVFSSDGVVEAGADKPFGVDRLKECVWANRTKPSTVIAGAVVDAVRSFAGNPSDDVSVVVTKVL